MRLFSLICGISIRFCGGKRIKITGKQLKNAVFSVKFCSTFHQTTLYQATECAQNEKRYFRHAPPTGPL